MPAANSKFRATDTTRRVLITGATRGLGKALSERFVETGHVVWGCGRDQGRVRALALRFPAPHSFRSLDVAKDVDVAAWAEEILANGEAPDLLINNAALINDPAPLWQVPARTFADVIDVNINGVANVIRHFLPAMLRRRRGVIVNVSSGWGRSAAAGVAPYCATKWAIEGLTQALAQELPAGIAAVALNPGVIHTEMLEEAFGSEAASSYDKPEEWSLRAVPFLLALGPAQNGVPQSLDRDPE